MPLYDSPEERKGLIMDSDYFASPPFRSYFFLGDSVILLVVTGMAIFVLATHGNQIPPSTMFCLGSSMVFMFVFWSLAFRNYKLIHKLRSQGQIGQVLSGSPVDLTLRAAATMMRIGMFGMFMLFGLLIIGINAILR
jgi:hypothetical protein